MIPRRNRELPFGRNSFLFSYKRRYNGNLCARSVQQAKAAYDEAALNLEVSQRSMNKASVQYQVGSISRLEYLQAESGFVSAQTGLEVKRLALLQAMENYSWIVKGVRS